MRLTGLIRGVCNNMLPPDSSTGLRGWEGGPCFVLSASLPGLLLVLLPLETAVFQVIPRVCLNLGNTCSGRPKKRGWGGRGSICSQPGAPSLEAVPGRKLDAAARKARPEKFVLPKAVPVPRQPGQVLRQPRLGPGSRLGTGRMLARRKCYAVSPRVHAAPARSCWEAAIQGAFAPGGRRMGSGPFPRDTHLQPRAVPPRPRGTLGSGHGGLLEGGGGAHIKNAKCTY